MVSTCLYHLCMVIWGMVYYCFNHIMLNDKCPWRYWCSTNSVIFFTLEPFFWLIPVHCSISLVRRYTISSLYRLNKIEPIAQVSIWKQPLIYNPHPLSQFRQIRFVIFLFSSNTLQVPVSLDFCMQMGQSATMSGFFLSSPIIGSIAGGLSCVFAKFFHFNQLPIRFVCSANCEWTNLSCFGCLRLFHDQGQNQQG